MSVFRLAGVVAIWVILVMWADFAGLNLTYHPEFPASEMLQTYGSRLLTTFAQFDGVHYLTIAEKGYRGTGLIQAFFPLYPLLVSGLSFGFINKIAVGMVISVLSLLGGLFFLYRLILVDEQADTAKKSLALLLLFPSSFFLMALYTESLFLLLVVTSFYAARKNKWWAAGLLGLLASTTRLVGVFLFPALLYEYWVQRKKITINIIWCFGPLIGLLLYMGYLWTTFGDPLLFYHVQNEFGSSRTTSELILLPRVFYRYFMMLWTTPLSNPIYPILVEEMLAGLFGLISLGIGWFKLRKSYVVYGVGAFLLPTLTGSFSSMPRYLLPIFPLFIVMAKYLPKRAYIAALIISGVILVYNIIRFTSGLWVA